MYKYAKEFPTKVIPHITDTNEINDIIHNYKRSSKNGTAAGTGANRVLSMGAAPTSLINKNKNLALD